jgi:NADH-quinone oxidoreductase subunit N
MSIGIPSVILVVSSIIVLYIRPKSAIILGSLISLLSALLFTVFWILGVEGYYIFQRTVLIDRLGYFISIAASLTTFIVLLGSMSHIEIWPTSNSFVSLSLLTLLGIIYLSFSNNIILIIISWTISSAATYAITVLRKDYFSSDAGLKYLIMGIISSSFLILGLSLYIVSSSNLEIINLNNIKFITIILLSIVLLSVAFLFKIGAFPFQSWLPDVYIMADRVSVALVSSIGKFIGLTPLVRILYNLLSGVNDNGIVSLFILTIFSLISILSLTYGNVIAFSRKELSALLAYSSIAQAGFFLLGVSVLPSNVALAGIILHLISYSIAQAGLFLFTSYIEKLNGSSRFEALRGLSNDRILSFSVIMMFLSLLGVPPLLGFWSKLFIFASTFSYPWLTVIGVIMSAISAGYYIPPLREMFREGNVEIVKSTERTATIIAGILILALGLIAPLIYGVIV